MTKPLSGSRRQCPRILVVDNDDLVRRSLARVLRREFEVITASDAEDAIAKIADDLFAVVTDHDLGAGQNGRVVLEAVRRRAPKARRILISGERQRPGNGEDGLWHAMLVKPVLRVELFDALVDAGLK